MIIWKTYHKKILNTECELINEDVEIRQNFWEQLKQIVENDKELVLKKIKLSNDQTNHMINTSK